MENWQPSASLAKLQARAQLLRDIREFFYQRGVLEVDTPVLSQCAVSDPFIEAMAVDYVAAPGQPPSPLYLQSSPEYAMKRLLCAGSGSIYQLSKVYRNGEYGKRHNPEFTMLEWYRPGMDDAELMDEVADLVCQVLSLPDIPKLSYSQLFYQQLGFYPEALSCTALEAQAREHVELQLSATPTDRDFWLNLLMSQVIEPRLKHIPALFVTDYPASQAALARVRKNADGQPVAARFELFVQGVELANGYYELTDWQEQQKRLDADQQQRAELGLPQRPLEQRLVAALKTGMPECSGVALGVDRLLMLAQKAESLAEVIPFDLSRA